MCGIVGGVAQRDVAPILMEGLKRLEYRGYDSAGLALARENEKINRIRVAGKVGALEDLLRECSSVGGVGIAHTRWATHGGSSINNAHPHICGERIALVHNGIIENHQTLREEQSKEGHRFSSETDTEVVVNRVYDYVSSGNSMLEAVQKTGRELKGTYALVVIDREEPDRLVIARKGSPLVIGLGIGENFVASDVYALLPVTRRFIHLEEGDSAEITRDVVNVYDDGGKLVQRPESISELSAESSEKCGYKHFMLKEIFSQAQVVGEILEGRIDGGFIADSVFGANATKIFDNINNVTIVACGTSYHAGLVAKYWMEELAGLSCTVEIASEFRYRKPVIQENSLLVAISQSGETADTLAAVKQARAWGYGRSLAICNVPESSLTRESDLVFMTRAGPEIGVASTKAFTTQLVALMMLVTVLGRRRLLQKKVERDLVKQLESLPSKINAMLDLDEKIVDLAQSFANKKHTLYLGRGSMYPIAMEGALKLKEISYIHAEAYPAGELKHGPLALVDEDMPVISIAPNDDLLEKLTSNLEEVNARGGKLFLFADGRVDVPKKKGITVIKLPSVPNTIAPIVYTVALQLFSYHVAVIKGADVDQPRNLAKSVTVE